MVWSPASKKSLKSVKTFCIFILEKSCKIPCSATKGKNVPSEKPFLLLLLFKKSMLLSGLFEYQRRGGKKADFVHFLHCSDSLAWKLFYMAGCFFVAAQNLEQWEVRCWTQEMRVWVGSSWQLLIPAAPRTCSVQTDKLCFWFWGNPLGFAVLGLELGQ